MRRRAGGVHEPPPQPKDVPVAAQRPGREDAAEGQELRRHSDGRPGHDKVRGDRARHEVQGDLRRVQRLWRGTRVVPRAHDDRGRDDDDGDEGVRRLARALPQPPLESQDVRVAPQRARTRPYRSEGQELRRDGDDGRGGLGDLRDDRAWRGVSRVVRRVRERVRSLVVYPRRGRGRRGARRPARTRGRGGRHGAAVVRLRRVHVHAQGGTAARRRRRRSHLHRQSMCRRDGHVPRPQAHI
mmetsp:Transcript_37966/g.90860  ORF Transcript_37966/g.90860 Transcript_37966/m.90860 type:complete len:241 (+) Transcript_37966:828-1550(+)